MTTPTTNFSNKDDRKPIVIFSLAITTILALLFCTYLYYDHAKLKSDNAIQLSKIDSLSVLKSTLDNEMTVIKNELNQSKGTNKELEQALAAANQELSAKEIKIKKLIASNASITRLQKEVKELRLLKDNHLKRIHELEEQVNSLTKQNEELSSQNKDLLSRISELEGKVATLDKKVQIASIIKTENAIIIGEKKNKHGKFIPSKLKKSERLLITFDLDENKVADAGEKTFYIRVINPSGKLIENSGSGSFTNGEKNIAMPYTTIHKVNYSNAKQKVIIPVDLNAADHPKGTYNVEFYCNGYLSGIKKLNVK